jgi:hypothetical protein
MHWFDTAGEGSALIAGTRPGGNSANGNAVMFDAGKILTCGGSESFAKPQFPATTEASLIKIGAPNTQVQVSYSVSTAAIRVADAQVGFYSACLLTVLLVCMIHLLLHHPGV